MASPVKAVIANVDEQEAELHGNVPMQDVYFLPIPMATYKALSDAAAKRNLTFAQLITVAFGVALEK